MSHLIREHKVIKHSQPISATTRTKVSDFQNSIRDILGDSHHTFLQGSYKNDTCLSEINDVDIVAVRLQTYSGNYSTIVTSSKIGWEIIFSEIENKLKEKAQENSWIIIRGDKCIKIYGKEFDADIVPAVQVFNHLKDDNIAIYSFKKDQEKINFPTTHYNNGVKKNDLTNGNYKPVVRMFKSWVKNHFEGQDIISSYNIESLVYNAPNECFSDDHVSSFYNVGEFIINELTNKTHPFGRINSVCGNENILNNWDFQKKNSFKEKLYWSLALVYIAYHNKTDQLRAESFWDQAFNSQ